MSIREGVYEASILQTETIEELAIKLFDLQEALLVTKDEIAIRESEIYVDVSSESTGSGKPVFSNDTSRKAETRARLNLIKDHLNQVESARMQQKLVSAGQARLELLRSQISLSKAFLHGGE